MKFWDLATRTFSTAIMAVVFASAVLAQAGTSTITGTVTDPQGAPIAGASVKLIGTQGTARTVVTKDNGVYTFPSVQTGSYRIEVEQAGFKKASVSNFQALVDISVEVNVKLEIGQVSETVNVDAAGLESIVNTQDASLGNNFVSRQIANLPLEGRNVANLLSLQAGVTPDGSVTGGRRDQANITLDGIDVNDQQTGLDLDQNDAFSAVFRVNPDSVDEFRVTTANPDATKGRSSGAQISLITKSGSNQFHGALYEYHRNTVTTANNWFSNAAGSYIASDPDVLAGVAKAGDPISPRPQLIRNLFGGRLGGPIVKDRLFFFYNYEGMREAKSEPRVRTVPLASLGAGTIKFRDNTNTLWTITAAQINTFTLTGGTAAGPVVDVNQNVVSLFGAVSSQFTANYFFGEFGGDGLNTGGFRFNAPLPVKQNAHTARFDWAVTRDQKQQVSFRANYQQDVTGNAPWLPNTPPTNTWSHPLGFAATHTWLVRSNLTNRASYGLTRLAFSDQGDSSDPDISFRYVFSPRAYRREFSRINPTQNIADDMTWIKGNHTFQFGTNIRLIKNTRVDFAKAFDNAQTNPSGYQSNVARTVINQYITAQTGATRTVATAWNTPAQGALVALLGRLNSYGANVNFNQAGTVIPPNTGIKRIFKTDEYDFYFQDSWKIRQNFTLTAGVRYGLSMPVKETQGYDTIPSIVLSDYLAETIRQMNRGVNYREPLSVRKAGDESIYPLDKNNIQPRVSVAWSPSFEKGFLAKLFGKDTESVFRGGFSITNDYFGQQLASNWDGSNSLGFSTESSINVNTFNITTNPAPPYTGAAMNIRSLPNLIIPANLTFPQTAPFEIPGNGKIETSLDQNLVSPINYSWNVSYGRKLPGKMWMDVAYVARLARNLLIGRDVMMLRDIRDPISGMSYNEAATILDRQLQSGVPVTQIGSIAFFDNMWAAGSLRNLLGCHSSTPNCTNTQSVYYNQPGSGDWTYFMQDIDRATGSRYFFQGQYDALSAFGTLGKSDYHGLTVSLRQRLSNTTWDFNYTFSKSLDNSSGTQTDGLFGYAFVLNAFKLDDQRSYSDFDMKHLINFNGVWDIPVGRDRQFGRGMNRFLNAVIGGWSLSGVFRWDSGYPFDGFYDDTGWQTNWNIRSYMSQRGPTSTGVFFNTAPSSCTLGCSLPNLFANPDAAAATFRTPHPGETGSRNPLRFPSAFTIDASLAKSFDMPWKEGHKLTFKWDVFNVTNTPSFTGQSTNRLGYTGTAPDANFGQFTRTRYDARVMQFALRYDF